MSRLAQLVLCAAAQLASPVPLDQLVIKAVDVVPKAAEAMTDSPKQALELAKKLTSPVIDILHDTALKANNGIQSGMEKGLKQVHMEGLLQLQNTTAGTDTTVNQQKAHANSLGELVSVVTPTSVMGFALLLVFVYFRNGRKMLYQPRSIFSGRHMNPTTFPPLSERMRDWVPQLLRVSDEEVRDQAGMDAVVLLRFLRQSLFICAGFFVYAFVIIIPVNYTVNYGELESHDKFAPYSIRNIPSGSDRLWCHVLSLYLFTFVCLYMWWRNYKKLRQLHWGTRSFAQPEYYTVMIRNIPSAYRTEQALGNFFRERFQDVHSVTLVKEVDKLWSTLKALDKCHEKLFVAYAKQMDAKNNNNPEPTMRVTECTSCGGRPRKAGAGCVTCCEEKGVVAHWERMKADLEKELNEKQEEYGKSATDTAFVSFKSLLTASIVAMEWKPFREQPHEWLVLPAPAPTDVYWPNLQEKLSVAARSHRNNVVRGALFFLFLFWIIPVGFISALTTLDSLQEYAPWLEPVIEWNSGFKAFLQGFLPTVCLLIFMALLPIIFRVFARYEGLARCSDQENYIAKFYYLFNVINVLLVTCFAQSITESLKNMVDNPTDIPSLLAENLPSVAPFFMQYICFNAFTRAPLELSQLLRLLYIKTGDHLRSLMTYASMAASRKELVLRDEIARNSPKNTPYGRVYGFELLMFAIVATYSCVSPLILLFGTCSFLITYLVWKHQVLYVYSSRHEGCGSFWPTLYRCLVASLLIAHMLMIGILTLMKSGPMATVMAGAPLITLYVARYCTEHYDRFFVQYLPTEKAKERDLANAGPIGRAGGLDGLPKKGAVYDVKEEGEGNLNEGLLQNSNGEEAREGDLSFLDAAYSPPESLKLYRRYVRPEVEEYLAELAKNVEQEFKDDRKSVVGNP